MPEQLSFLDQSPKIDKHQTDLTQELESIAINKDRLGVKLLDLIPTCAVLEVSKHYETREVLVSRILGFLQDNQANHTTISRDEIGQRLSMTKALAEGTTSVMRRLELIDSENQITPWGILIRTHCPYLDDVGILWLLHYLLASNAQLVLWSNLFNFILNEQDEVTLQKICEFFQPLRGRWSEKSIKDKLPLEVNSIFKTYTQALFSRLGLIQKLEKAFYAVYCDTGLIPENIWLSTIQIYRDRYYPGAPSLEIPLIINGHFSPGRILRQNEVAVRSALDVLHNHNLLTIETRSGLDQVRFRREVTWLSAAARHLKESKAK
jgi:hypothetical protein